MHFIAAQASTPSGARADAHVQVDAGALDRGRDRAEHVAVA